MMRGKDATLHAILNTIIDDEPETQDEIAEKLDVSRRYVAKLLKPLIDDKVVKHPYVLNIDKIKDYGKYIEEEKFFGQIINSLHEMGNCVVEHNAKIINALNKNDIEEAKSIIVMDYMLNRMEDELNLLIKMKYSKYLTNEQILLITAIASNIERCGDYLSNIAEEIVDGLIIGDNIKPDIHELQKTMTNMFPIAMQMTIDREVNMDIYEQEKKLHRIIDKLLDKISKQPTEQSNILKYIEFGMFLKDVERFGDRSIKIYELSRELHYNIPSSNKIPENVRNS
ncbi:PhoU domain-containing protein [Methanococcus voltae]|uniref:Phosphate uptake regulator, PhoU n=1 Tax=Methanococcus voltae (strain ATCC BAA-1334 / A3) TaxID=456320 RepID=D7DS05_METV3|nr:PhoU domain-containing protein [Methanococcus voltae]MCS3901440.1 phosphate transport system protein [Methanococcus voltae]